MEINLKSQSWGEFFIEDVFNIKSGKRLVKAEMSKGSVPFIGASDSNNGITEFISNKNSSLDKNVLGVNYNGSVVENFYHPYEALFSDDVKRLSFKEFEGNKYLFLFVKNIILKQKDKYEYGYKFNGERMKRQKILLPINNKNELDYAFMEAYIHELERKKQNKYLKYIQKRVDILKNTPKPEYLKNREWREFFIEDIGAITSGADIYEAERIKGETPYITATANNNGIGYFVGNKNTTLDKNFLSVNRNGSVGYSFYHSYISLISNDCRRIKLNVNNRHVGLFVSNQITIQKAKYGYGYKMGTGRLKRQKIMLPIKSDETPDYQYMESYMKYLECQKLKEYLEFKKARNN